jgi:hypothetical protein
MIGSRFIIAPLTLALMIVTACLASSAAAQSCSGCTLSSCPYSQEWSPKSFLEDTPTETNSSATKEIASKASDDLNSSAKVPTLSIDLKNASAEPNPADLGRPVKITVAFGESSSNKTSDNSTATKGAKKMAYATIRNSAGTEVDRVNLDRTSGEEYAGIWNANVAVGVYQATIVVSTSGASKIFDNALEIEIIPSSKGKPGIKKLG